MTPQQIALLPTIALERMRTSFCHIRKGHREPTYSQETTYDLICLELYARRH